MLRLVVSELDDVWLGSEEGLVDVYLGVDVNRVVANVEELDDLGLGILVDGVLAGVLFLVRLDWGLHKRIRLLNTRARRAELGSWDLPFSLT